MTRAPATRASATSSCIKPDVIKLDISITRGVDQDGSRRALASALISFAAEVDASLVAEGVETIAEMKTLQRLGVTLAQGYLFARPGPLPLPTATPLERGPLIS